jgi:F-type H+-transporting ATPase subunit a
MRKSNILVVSFLLSFASPLFAQPGAESHSPDSSHSAQAHPAEEAHPEQAEGAHPAAHAEEAHAEEEDFNASEVILHHVLDNHDWHITDIPAGTDAQGRKRYAPIAIHLPWFFYSSREGWVFSSTENLIAKGYLPYHDKVYALRAGAEVPHADEHGKMHLSEAEWEAYKSASIDAETKIYDFSITKTSLQMLLIGLLLIFVFLSVARSYRRNAGAPKGMQSLFEPIIVFIRDEIAKPYLHHKADRFVPYLLTLFFFIWFANLLGLTPLNSNIAGNISVTAALAFLSFLIINFNGTKDYWQHIFAPPGVPTALRFTLMPVVEVIGVFTKPFALMVRLFANISAGHFMVLSLVSLIFILGKNGQSLGGALGAMPLSLLFTFAIFFLEMVVAIIQAYIFTLLTAVFLGMALESHDSHGEEGHAHH